VLRTEPTLIEEYVGSGRVRLQFWHILDHANASVKASMAAECAGQQGAFWRMHDTLFENQEQLWGAKLETHVGLAANLGLDAEAFRQCMAGDVKNKVIGIDQQAKANGVRIRPTFDISASGGESQRVQGSPPLDQWRALLDALP
jgi:protein-disulfide isomerase